MNGFDHGFALIMGVANYSTIRRLPNTVLNDAQNIHDILCDPNYCGYSEAKVRLLLDKQADLDNCRKGFEWLAQQAGDEDTVIVFFSGHGGRIEAGPEAGNYLLPYDANIYELKTTAFSGGEITGLLNAIHVQKLVVLFDCCHAGGIGDVKSVGNKIIDFKSGMRDQYYEQLASGKGRVIIASSREEEYSLVMPGMNNSLFTHYLLDGLKGNVRTQGDGMVRIFELFDHVSQSLTSQGDMHPVFKAHNLENNFAIALFPVNKAETIISTSSIPKSRKADLTHYSHTDLRRILVSALSEEELLIFCRDYFPESLAQFSQGMSLITKADLLVSFCERRGLTTELVEKLNSERPNSFSLNEKKML